MKKLFFLILVSFLMQVSYSQFHNSGMCLGFQVSKNYMKNAYYKTSTDADNNISISSSYNDRFNFNHTDLRLYSQTDGMMLSGDGSSIFDLLYVVALLAIDKDTHFTGKLRKIDDNLGANTSGYGQTWSYVQVGFALGGDMVYMGLDVDIGGIGVTQLENAGAIRNGSWLVGVGGIGHVVTDQFRGTLRVDKVFSGTRIGLGVIMDADYAINDYMYAGLYYKFYRIGGYYKSIENPSIPDNKYLINAVGVRLGFWIEY